MFSFEGNFRSTPDVSLGGKSKEKTARSSLLIAKKARDERRKREVARRELRSSLVLQSSIRSFLVRKKLKEEFRLKFDNDRQKQLTDSQLHEATRLICYFYETNSTADAERLIWICQNYIKFVRNQKFNCSSYLLSELLVLCCRCLLKDSTAAPAVPLRMLEIFTESKYWKTEETFLWERLIKNDFFSCLIHVIEKKVPSDIEASSGSYKSPHLLLADSLLDIMKLPFNFLNKFEKPPVTSHNARLNDTFHLIFQRFISDVLSHPITLQIHNYILPSLSKDPSFPTETLMGYIRDALSPNRHDRLSQTPTNIQLLAAFMCLIKQRSMTNSSRTIILSCLRWLVPTLPKVSDISNQDDGISDDDEENHYDVEMSTSTNDVTASHIVSECCDFLNSSTFVNSCVKLSVQDPENIAALCEIAYHLISRLRLSVITNRFLYTLAFSSPFLKMLWNSVIALQAERHNSVSSQSSIRALLDGCQMAESSRHTLITRLVTFSSLFSHNLLSLHDVDFYGTDKTTFALRELTYMVTTLKDICLSLLKKILPETRWHHTQFDAREIFQKLSTGKLIYNRVKSFDKTTNIEHAALAFKALSHLLNQLHTRHTRRPFTKDDVWLSHSSMIGEDRSKYLSSNWRRRHVRNDNLAAHMADPSDEDLPMTISEARQLTILTTLPFVVPFDRRVSIFTSMLTQDRIARESSRDVLMQDAGFADSSRVIQVKVRRNYLYEDAFNDLSNSNAPDLRRVLRVTFVNEAGAEEAGYGEGVTREFLQQLIKTAFEPTRGLFKITGDSGLYPNPHADRIIENVQQHFNFLGRLLGKVICEGMQIELPFAAFFLCKLLRHKNVDVDINHLQSLDPDFYKNLMFLRSYEDVADLHLNFTVVDDSFGETKVTELVRGGHDIAVTNDNRVRYIHLLSNYKLNIQMRFACDAFRNGLSSVVPLEWLRMFDHRELQTLISGAEVPISVEDMRVNAAYSGGYKSDHPTIILFWEVLATFSEEEKRKLLLFVTSCSRPPLLGFKEMHPPFCVHNGGEADRLPTSSTCLNLLRLPQYQDARSLREKLLYGIGSQSGFELS